MNLEEGQKKQVEAWINQGLKLSEIQTRMDKEMGLRLTYMEVRLLVDDLKLTLKDPEQPKPAQPAEQKPAAPETLPAEPEVPPGKVSLSVDQITRAGAVISGKVTFSDGNKADWYLDQSGRLGFGPQKQGYRPSAGDVQQFQALLESELSKLGFQ